MHHSDAEEAYLCCEERPVMRRSLRKLIKIGSGLRAATPWMSPAPKTPFFAIGDIHGRVDLLRQILVRIDEIDAIAPIVIVGDMIDRGHASGEVLKVLFKAATAPNTRIVCLKGNHEDMLLKTLKDPVVQGPRWLANGGVETVASMGIVGASRKMGADDLILMAEGIRKWLGPNILAWLEGLPLVWQSGTVWVVHAGAAPSVAMEKQRPEHLMWGHPHWPRRSRRDGQWIVHGHVVVEVPFCVDGEIAVDTGAYATGVLSSAYVSKSGAHFLSVRRESRARAGVGNH